MKLKGFVTVHGDDGLAYHFGPDDTVPGWAAARITNPNVLGSAQDAGVRPSRQAKVAEWRDYAESVGVDPEGLSKAQLIAALADDSDVELSAEPADGDTEPEEDDESSEDDT